MTINFKLVAFALIIVPINIHSQIYESIEKSAAGYILTLSTKDSKAEDGLKKLGAEEVILFYALSAGTPVTSGVYFVRLSSGNYVETKKMMYLK